MTLFFKQQVVHFYSAFWCIFIPLLTKVGLEALKGEKTTAELCQEYGIVASQLFKWRKQLLDNGSLAFESGAKKATADDKTIEKLHATIGKLTVENHFLEHVLGRR